jgi:hypothetical protein
MYSKDSMSNIGRNQLFKFGKCDTTYFDDFQMVRTLTYSRTPKYVTMSEEILQELDPGGLWHC